MTISKLRGFLDGYNIKYVTINHSPAYTAQEIAAASHIAGQNLAKTVIVKIDGTMVMAVMPAPYKIDLERFATETGSNKAEMAHETELVDVFPECETGAMPPFGNLFDMKVYVDKTLTHDSEIAFNACDFTVLIKLAYKDFEHLVKPETVEFAIKA